MAKLRSFAFVGLKEDVPLQARSARKLAWPAALPTALLLLLLRCELFPRAGRQNGEGSATCRGCDGVGVSFSLPLQPSGSHALEWGRGASRHYLSGSWRHCQSCAARAAGQSGAEVTEKGEGASVTASSLNLAKNLVGSGVLSLPSGVAAFSASPSALVPAMLLLVAATLISAYGFVLIGRACEASGSDTFGGAWNGTIHRGAWFPALACLLECLGGSVIYAMVLGDVFSPLLGVNRNTLICVLGATVLFPLCSLGSFKQLAKFSLLGTIASCFVPFVVAKRFLDGSYAAGGAFHAAGAAPALLAGPGGVNPQMLILVSILSTAFLVHFNAPQMYSELRPSGRALTEEALAEKRRNLSVVAGLGFGLAAAQYALVMAFGFLTFGRFTEGNLLTNYAVGDSWAFSARFAVGISTLFGYPMQFVGLRDGLAEAAGVQLIPLRRRVLTALLLTVVVAMACALRDLGRFQALEGAVLATFLIYIAPPMMTIRLPGGRARQLRLVAMGMLGLAASVIGCVVTLGMR